MGLVVFSGFAELAVPPTTDRKALAAAIDGLTTGRGTAIGAAMLKGIDAIAEVNPACTPVGDAAGDGPARRRSDTRGDGYVPDIVVLLTDGANNRGIDRSTRSPTRSSGGSGSTRSASGRPPGAVSPARASSSAGTRFDPDRFGGGGGGGFGGGGGSGAAASGSSDCGRADPAGGRERDRRHLPRRRRTPIS